MAASHHPRGGGRDHPVRGRSIQRRRRARTQAVHSRARRYGHSTPDAYSHRSADTNAYSGAYIDPGAYSGANPDAGADPDATSDTNPYARAYIDPGADPGPGPAATPTHRTVTVDVQAQQADGLGSLEFVLVFDPEALDLQMIELGVFAEGVLMKTSETQPGRLGASFVSLDGLSGAGPLLRLTFQLSTAAEMPVAISIEEVSAYHAETLLDIPVETIPGSLAADGVDSEFPTLVFR